MALAVAVVIAAKNGRQVEAKAIHVHFAGPVAQRVGDQLQHAGVAQVQRVAGAGIVDVVTFVVRHQAVVRGVVDAAHGQGRAAFVAFGGVVVDHVEDYLKAGVVKVGDHFLELGNLAAGQVARVRGEKGDAVVAPVVVQAFVQQVLVVDEGVNRQQLDAGDAQLLDVLEQLVVGQAGKGAAQFFRHCRVAHADAAGVRFINDRAFPGDRHTLVAAPGEGRVDHLAFGHEGRAVALIERQVAVGVADGVAEQCL